MLLLEKLQFNIQSQYPSILPLRSCPLISTALVSINVLTILSLYFIYWYFCTICVLQIFLLWKNNVNYEDLTSNASTLEKPTYKRLLELTMHVSVVMSETKNINGLQQLYSVGHFYLSTYCKTQLNMALTAVSSWN